MKESKTPKYAPLRDYLKSIPTSNPALTLAYSEVEEIIGDTLPPSASKHREWWANQERGSPAKIDKNEAEQQARPADVLTNAGFTKIGDWVIDGDTIALQGDIPTTPGVTPR